MRFETPAGATPIDANEAEGLIPALSTQADLNEFEALNIARGVSWAVRSLNEADFLTVTTLLALHKKMFDKTWRWAGKVRVTHKSVGIESAQIWNELKRLMDDVVFWIENITYPSEEIAARFHHRLTWIHAFPNGNGRHARIATDVLARRLDLRPLTWGAGSKGSQMEVRTAYIEALRSADHHDFAPLLTFIRS